MAFLVHSKDYGVSMYPVHANDTSGLTRRTEPLITPEQLVSRYLKGIPLRFPNGDFFSADDLKDKIYLAQNEAELLLGMVINRESFKDKVPFDWNLYKSYIHIRTEQGPIVSLQSLAIVASDGEVIFEVPSRWIEAANFSKRLINVIPLLSTFGSNSISGSPVNSMGGQGAGLAFLSIWSSSGGLSFTPAYWQILYTSGLSNEDGKIPTPVNELIGILAAIEVLSGIAPTNVWTSQSLSQDSISQSSSSPGPRIYQERIAELGEKRDTLVKKLKAMFSSRYFIGNL